QYLCRGRAVVVRPAALATPDPRREGCLAEVAPCRELQEALDARTRERDDMLAGMTEVVTCPLGCRAHEIGKPREIGFALEHELVALLIGEHILGKGRAERREPRIDL